MHSCQPSRTVLQSRHTKKNPIAMARRCDACERGPLTGNTRSHSKIASKTRRLVNLQTKTISGVKMKVCTRCIRTLAPKEKATA